MNTFDLGLSLLLTFALHASVLLALAWAAERAGWLHHPGAAELAWRVALFGALVSTGLQFAPRPPLPALTIESFAAPRADASRLPLAATPAQLPAPRRAVEASGAATVQPGTPAPVSRGDEGHPVPPPAARHAGHLEPAEAATTGDARVLSLPAWAAAALLSTWALSTTLAALRLLMQLAALRRLRRNSIAVEEQAPPQRHARGLAEGFGLPAPPLRWHAGIHSPMALPGGDVLLPAWVEGLPDAQQRALLAHEIAHLHRRDPAWRLLQRLALLPLSFHPLAHHAVRRLEALAEDACDAHAARRLGSGRPLAECLAACLSHAGARAAHPALAVAMAGDAGPVVRRVQNLLEDLPMSPRSLSPTLRRSVLAIALAAAVALPGLAVTTYAGPAQASGSWLENVFGGDSLSYDASDDDGRLQVKLSGKVGFNADESDVRTLGKGARLLVRETRDGVTREILFEEKDGGIVREYKIGGDRQPLDSAGRNWLARALPRILRETAIDADGRGKRILARDGVDGLLAEIALIRSDYAARRYLQVLFENASLDGGQLGRALAAARDIGSDFELRQALASAFDHQKLSPAHQAQVLAAARSIGSDFELAELLGHFAQTQPVQGATLPAWREALATIGSDFEHRRVLEALLEGGKATPGAVRVALESSAGIGSDFELRQVLEKAAPATRADGETLAAWLRAAGGIGSDFEHREALVALIEAGPVDVPLATGALVSLADIGSDFEARRVLETLAARMPNDAALIERYRAAARRLGDFERGQAEKALDRFYAAN